MPLAGSSPAPWTKVQALYFQGRLAEPAPNVSRHCKAPSGVRTSGRVPQGGRSCGGGGGGGGGGGRGSSGFTTVSAQLQLCSLAPPPCPWRAFRNQEGRWRLRLHGHAWRDCGLVLTGREPDQDMKSRMRKRSTTKAARLSQKAMTMECLLALSLFSSTGMRSR